MAHAQTLQQMAELKARLSSEQHMTATLNAQLDDFIKTKNEAEIVMLQHFMVLLNEKKRKIRDLDRLLASAKTNQSTRMLIRCPQCIDKTDAVLQQPLLGRQEARLSHAKRAHPAQVSAKLCRKQPSQGLSWTQSLSRAATRWRWTKQRLRSETKKRGQSL